MTIHDFDMARFLLGGIAEVNADIRTIIELIGATTTQTGLKVSASYDPNWYPKGVKITDDQMNALPVTSHDWHPDWNYTITPNPAI